MEILIENGTGIKCPNCCMSFGISGQEEFLFRNGTLVYVKRNEDGSRTFRTKCRQCKKIIDVFENQMFKEKTDV